jgi:putative oxidoreductase
MDLADFIAQLWNLDGGWAMLPLRLALGVIFVHSGLGKWRRGISGTGRWLKGLGFPLPQATARLVATIELLGGVLLLAGLGVHWAGIPLAINMTVATWTQRTLLHAPFQGGEVQGYELDVLMAAGSLTLAIGGAGPLSLDALLRG